LVFESNIPTGYGAGSSGAIVAAIFDRFQAADVNWPNELPTLKKALAQMESFFHGTSSGTDPLICYLQKTVLLGGASSVEIVAPNDALAEIPHTIFLLDTGIQRQATPFIQYFLGKTQDDNFAALVREELLPSVNAAIRAFLIGDSQAVFDETASIGEFQFLFLEEMVPEAFRQIWQLGLDGNLFKLKVCGAGGGGFLLGITSDFEATAAALLDYKLLPVMAF
jgi:mevalonate kinase